MSELLLSAEALVVPSTGPNPLTFDMRKIHKAEARLHELATVTKAKAGELQYVFIDAYSEAKDYLAVLVGELGRCKQKLKCVGATILLDRAVDVLKEKGLVGAKSPAGSEDLRDAVVNRSAEYNNWFDVMAQVEVAASRMETKVSKLKMAYFSVGSLTKDPDAHRDTSGGVGDDPTAPTFTERVKSFVEENKKPTRPGFGSAKL